MKLIKLLLCCLVIFIITGCTKEYKLYLSDNKIVEKFHMVLENNNKYSYSPKGDFYPLHNDFNHKYKKKLKTENGNSILDLEYTYSLSDFINANSFNQCFDEREIKNTSSDYEIRLGKPNGCMFNEDYTINIITDNKVLDNNAEIVKGNQYIWHVNNKKGDNFTLHIKIRKGNSKYTSKKYSFFAYVFLVSFVVILLMLVIIFIRRKKINNRM